MILVAPTRPSSAKSCHAASKPSEIEVLPSADIWSIPALITAASYDHGTRVVASVAKDTTEKRAASSPSAYWLTSFLAKAFSPPGPSIEPSGLGLFIEPLSSSTRAKSTGVAQGGLGDGGGGLGGGDGGGGEGAGGVGEDEGGGGVGEDEGGGGVGEDEGGGGGGGSGAEPLAVTINIDGGDDGGSHGGIDGDGGGGDDGGSDGGIDGDGGGDGGLGGDGVSGGGDGGCGGGESLQISASS